MVIFGILFLIFEQTQLDIFVIIGTEELIAGIVTGLITSFYAMKKYNGGLMCPLSSRQTKKQKNLQND